jgi:hypothetical protein
LLPIWIHGYRLQRSSAKRKTRKAITQAESSVEQSPSGRKSAGRDCICRATLSFPCLVHSRTSFLIRMNLYQCTPQAPRLPQSLHFRLGFSLLFLACRSSLISPCSLPFDPAPGYWPGSLLTALLVIPHAMSIRARRLCSQPSGGWVGTNLGTTKIKLERTVELSSSRLGSIRSA